MIIVKEVLKTRKYKAGYEIRDEIWSNGGHDTRMKAAYNYNGDYIGNSKFAYRLCKKHGIKPEKSDPNHSVCSIGFCEHEQKWYGWSHRAIVGFGLGDKIFEEGYGDDHTPFIQHGQYTIETLIDAKIAAINFARSVS